MNKTQNPGCRIVQLNCGLNYSILESLETIELLLNDPMIDNKYFIPFHLSGDNVIIKIKKETISAFYEWNEE